MPGLQLDVWEIRCRPLGPGTPVRVWAVRAGDAEDALGFFTDAGWEESDVLCVRRARVPDLDS